MEQKVRKFDEEWKRQESYRFLLTKVGWVLFLGLGTFCMMIPWQEAGNVTLIAFILLAYAATLYLQPYMDVTENRKPVSITKKLSFTPAGRGAVFAVRRSYLNRFCLMFFPASFLMQQAGALLDGGWNGTNLLVPCAIWAVLWCVTILYLHLF